MLNTQTELQWEPTALEKYNKMLTRIPVFHRDIARQVVLKKAGINAKARGSAHINESDLTQAFVSEVPKAFYSLMVRIMDEVGLDYKKYHS
ncbi:MAG: DUF2621 family protein [Candidatus Omnitrophica bacterium]|nr:DUF2621 family protein [Candidatus Omnitrophota bacterium]